MTSIRDLFSCIKLICNWDICHIYEFYMIFNFFLLSYRVCPLWKTYSITKLVNWIALNYHMKIFFQIFRNELFKDILLLCNKFFWTLCKLCNPLLPSGSQDWVFNVIIGVLGSLQIFNNFSIEFSTSFKLLYLYKNTHNISLKYVFLIT